MNICHVIPIFHPGKCSGSTEYVQSVSEGLANRGHEVTVLTADAVTGRGWVDPLGGEYASKKVEWVNGVRVRRLKTRWQMTSASHLLQQIPGSFLPESLRQSASLFSVGPYLSNLKKEFENERYEVIHATTFPFALVYLAWKACQALEKPFVCSPFIHFEDPRYDHPLLWKTLQGAEVVIACSRYEKERMIERGIDPSRIIQVSLGISLNGWQRADGERFRRKYDLEGKRILLFVGTKSYDKGAIHLLKAMERIKQKMEDLVLVTIGLPTREWREHTRNLNVSYLLDLGYVSDEEKKDAFAACDLFVMPSRSDSFGIVYLEAWACSKPVIGARVGAIPEIIQENEDGALVDFGNVEDLSSKMAYLMSHPNLRQSMGEAGRKKVLEQFNWEKDILRIESAFKRARSN
jgi:glycosyltransferase involved in cell wall biosynthesis